VVMGRLSPRTRNAQVALYQDKEVDFLVATDAIGMGLNMDVDHVAFARLNKFDGHRPRALTASEVAQIAGRAGRGMRDGTFGTTGECMPMEDELVNAVENHHFQPLGQIFWRESELDFSGIDALLASLNTAPSIPGLVRGNDATDVETLSALAREPEMRGLADRRSRVRLLWEACQIPDFRKLADETHTRLCGRIFSHIARDGRLPADWLAHQIDGLARAEGDIDTLMARLAGVRTCTYIAARSDWVPDAVQWQARAREVEDLLSDALHERLTTRFVDRRAAHLMRRLDASDADELLSAVTKRGEVVVEGHPVGHIAGFSFLPDPSTEGQARKLVLRAARRALLQEMPRRVAALEAAEDSAFTLLPGARLGWDGARIARLRPGTTALRPAVEVTDSEFLDGPSRERIRVRLQRFMDDHVRAVLAPLFQRSTDDQPGPMRGLLHRLAEDLGIVPPVEDLPPASRHYLKARGIRAGRFALFVPALLKPRAASLRALLLAVRDGTEPAELPAPGLISIAPPDLPLGFALALGWLDAGPMLLRLDIAERIVGDLLHAGHGKPMPVPADLASRLSVRAEMLPAILRQLGFRLRPSAILADGQFGPAAPAMMELARRPRRIEAAPSGGPPQGNPFAALAQLRR